MSICIGFPQLVAAGETLSDTSLICPGSEVHKVSTFMNEVSIDLLTSDFIQDENRNVTEDEKKGRIKDRIVANHGQRVHEMPLTDDELAEVITWAADCMGHDFQVFAGLLEKESWICSDRTGPDGDRGCSMFTSDPIKELKNQMKLPGKLDNHSDKRVSFAMRELIKGCYESYQGLTVAQKQPGNAEDYIKLFSGSIKGVKNTFLAGHHIHADILSGALYLKFTTALSGGYWPNETPGIKHKYRSKGGVYKYNSSRRASAYRSDVKELATAVKFACFEDPYVQNILEIMCEMETDTEQCLADVKGGVSIAI